jgi:hypothetical protein
VFVQSDGFVKSPSAALRGNDLPRLILFKRDFRFQDQGVYPWISRGGLLSNGAKLRRNPAPSRADGLFTKPSGLIPKNLNDLDVLGFRPFGCLFDLKTDLLAFR